MSGSAESNSKILQPDAVNHTFAISTAGLSKFNKTAQPGHLNFVRLDEDLTVMNEDPPLTWTAVGKLAPVRWPNNPRELSPDDTAHQIATNPGRLAEDGNLLSTGPTDPVAALPTHHFAMRWILSSDAFSPPDHAAAENETSLNPGVVCTGPLVAELLPDPSGDVAMRLAVTVEHEAGVVHHETGHSASTRYLNANNGTVFLANEGHPWTVAEVTPLSISMLSARDGSPDSSDRWVYLSSGLVSAVYTGDTGGIVQNYHPDSVIGNRNNQHGYGSVGLGSERVFICEWDSTVNGEDPAAPAGDFQTAPGNSSRLTGDAVNEFLRLDLSSGLRVFAKSAVLSLDDPSTWAPIATGGGTPVAIEFNRDTFVSTFGGGNASGLTFGLDAIASDVNADLAFGVWGGGSATYTYYLATPAAIAVGGATANIIPTAVLTIAVNNETPTNLSVLYRIGNVWLPPQTGAVNPAVAPTIFAPDVEYNIPAFPNLGIPSHSEVSSSYVVAYPTDSYGVPAGASRRFLGAKRLLHDFSGTKSMLSLNFRVRQSDVVSSRAVLGSSLRMALVFWDPNVIAHTPSSIVTIARPSGYKIVEMEAAASSKNGTDSIEYVYSRRMVQTPLAFDGSVYAVRHPPTEAQLLANPLSPGSHIVSDADAAAIAAIVDSDFVKESGVDAWLWNGEALAPGDDTSALDYTRRIHANLLDWGRKMYRYVRYIEAMSRGRAPATIDSNAYGSFTRVVVSTIRDAALRVWQGVRHVLTHGLVPQYDVLERLRAGDAPTAALYSGMDILYAGRHGANKLSVKDYAAFLIFNGYYDNAASAAAAVVRLATAGFGTITDLGNATAEDIGDLVEADTANTAVDAAAKLTEAFLTPAVAAAKHAEGDYRFAEELGTFGVLRYDRGIPEHARNTRSKWGGFTSTYGHELYRWAVITDAAGVPDTTGGAIADEVYVTQLAHLPAGLTAEADIRFSDDDGFSFYTDHHRAYGYLAYAASVALRCAPEMTPPGHSRTVGEDVAFFLTTTDTANHAEPYPLLQIILDVAGPVCGTDVAAARGENTVGVARRCRGTVAPRTPDGIVRAYPPHRHFDAYAGHSWATGPVPGYIDPHHEASTEASVGYLGVYRLIQQFITYERATAGSSSARLLFLNGYAYLAAAATAAQMPVTTSVLTSEISAAAHSRATSDLWPTTTSARAQTHNGVNLGSLGVVRPGYPVVAGEHFVNSVLHSYVSASTPTGSMRRVDYTYDHVILRNFPAKFLLHVGAGVVPLSDISSIINTPTWTRAASGNHITRGGVVVEDDAARALFGGILSRYTTGDNHLVTLGDWIDHILADSVDDTAGAVDGAVAPATTPTREVQQWARLVAPALAHVVRPSGSAIVGAVAFPTDRDAYLPQSSWYDVLLWYRMIGAVEPTPDTNDPNP